MPTTDSITQLEVLTFYHSFLDALKSGDIPTLEKIYAEDYVLIRPNGDTLTKKEILADLHHHSMHFTSFDLTNVLIRTKESVGILTATVHSTAIRDSIEIKSHARQLAIISKENNQITISHFQSTNIADPK
jgi:ketosteroid isomerase-like protein